MVLMKYRLPIVSRMEIQGCIGIYTDRHIYRSAKISKILHLYSAYIPFWSSIFINIYAGYLNSEQPLNVLDTKYENRAAQKCSQTQRNVKDRISGRRRRKNTCFRRFLYEILPVSAYIPFWKISFFFAKKSAYIPVYMAMHPCTRTKSYPFR